jgi:hypothetical protein
VPLGSPEDAVGVGVGVGLGVAVGVVGGVVAVDAATPIPSPDGRSTANAIPPAVSRNATTTAAMSGIRYPRLVLAGVLVVVGGRSGE